MPKRSAGLLLYRRTGPDLEVLLVHPGGPYWAAKDDGAWSIPKGEAEPNEKPLEVAAREFTEELGSEPPDMSDAASLGEIRQAGGKWVTAWALEGDLDVGQVHSNTFTMEWPPRTGRMSEFPEVDRAGWFDLEDARRRLVRGQTAFIDRLVSRLGGQPE